MNTTKRWCGGTAEIPAWAAATAPGRFYARMRLRRNITKRMRDQGYTPGRICFHFALIDGHGVAGYHCEVTDDLAAALADDGRADR